MQARNTSRRQSPAVLLIIDAISEFQFPNAEKLLDRATKPFKRIANLKARAKEAQVPVVYINDMGNRWESDSTQFVERCTRPAARGRQLVELIAPEPSDYFIFKPKHSGFFDTPLESLLDRLRVKSLILTGLTSHQCVLFTAVDAYIRDYQLHVPRDCIGSPSDRETQQALGIFESALRAELALSAQLLFSKHGIVARHTPQRRVASSQVSNLSHGG